MTATQLLTAFAEGRTISLFDARTQRNVSGKVCGAVLESGFGHGERPQHFFVSLSLAYGGSMVRDIYIKTE